MDILGAVVQVADSGGPLSGVRVVELGSFVAGPFAGQLLADLGAEVLKVEPPGGDGLRSWGLMAPSGTSWWSYAQNRGKRLACVDVARPEGQALLRRLLGEVDVLVANLRPATIERWGLGPERLRRELPHLVYVAISGYGLTGPNSSLPGFGSIAECRGGLRYVTGFPDRPPVRNGISLGDAAAGMFAVIGALASLVARERGAGDGEVVDVSLADAVFALTEAAITEYVHEGVVRERTGNQLLRAAPSNVYRTADNAWFAIGANSDALFGRLVTAMGEPGLADDPRFADNQSRVAHADELDERIAGWVAGQTADEVATTAAEAGIPAGPVQSMAEIAADPQFRERDMIIEVRDPDSPELGPVTMVGTVPKLWNRSHQPMSTSSTIGRESSLLARWAGLDEDEYQRLLDAGVLVDAAPERQTHAVRNAGNEGRSASGPAEGRSAEGRSAEGSG